MSTPTPFFKRLLITIISFTLSSSGLHCFAFGTHEVHNVYSLRDIFDIIETRNPQILSSKENIDQAQYDLQVNEAAFWPNVDIVGTQTKTKTGGNEADFYTGKVTASMPILNLTTLANYQQADIEVFRASFGHGAFLQIIFREAANAFFNHLRNLKNLKFIETNLKRDEVLLDLAKTQLEAGIATPIDVTRAESVFASRKRQYLQQESAVNASELNLKRLLDIPESESLSLSDSTFDLDISDIAPQFEQALPLEVILNMRPDYLEAKQVLASEMKGLDKAAWESVPTLSVSSEAGYFGRRPLNGADRANLGITATVTMPVFEGFRIVSNKRKARSLIRKQEYSLREMRNRIESEYYQALFDNKARYEQILLALKQIELAELQLELAQNRFEQGISDNQEVVDAQANLANSQGVWVNVVFQYNVSRIQLAFVKGNVRTALNEPS